MSVVIVLSPRAGVHGIASVAPRSIVTYSSTGDRQPRPDLAVRPRDPDLRARRAAEPEVDRAELAAGVAAADRHLARRRPWSPARTSTQAPIASRFGAWLAQPDAEPVAHRLPGRRPCPHPTFRQSATFGRRWLTSTRSSRPSRLKSTSAAPRAAREVDDPGLLGALDERPVGLAEQQVARVLHGVVGLRVDVALATYRSMRPSLLTSSNSGCQAVDGRSSPPSNGRVAVTPREGDVAVRRLRRPGGQGLQLVVALAGEVDLRVAVAGQVLAGDAHAPDPQRLPAVGGGVQRAAARPDRSARAAPRRRRR